MQREPRAFYLDENDRTDQEFRRNINAKTIYASDARCEWCGDSLNGYTAECIVCKVLLCPLHSCADECCPEHTGAGNENVPQD